MTVDLNADVGESVGTMIVGDDRGVMASVTSVNVAAGFHGGDPSVLRRTLQMASEAGVAVGAHPGFQDREGFGRKNVQLTESEAEDLVLYQVAAVEGVARATGLRLQHVKPHGALYNMAAMDAGLARAIARAVAAIDPSLILVGPPGSELLRAGRAAGLPIAVEVFADRAYRADGTLVSRSEAGSVLTDSNAVVARAVRLVVEHTVEAIDGSIVSLPADTVCVHGDTPGAAALAAAVRRALESRGVQLRSLRGSAA